MRRLALIVVLLLWVVNGSLLAWVKMTPPPAAPPRQVELHVFCEKPEQAKKVVKLLRDAGFSPQSTANVAWKHDVLAGYRLVVSMSQEDLLKSMLASMKIKKLPVKIVGSEIQLGDVYKNKAEAMKARNAAIKQDYTFELRENHQMRTSKVTLVKLGPLSEEQQSKAEQALAKLNLKPEQMESKDVDAEFGSPAEPTPSVTPK
jgi:hypothetical protein